MTKTIEGQYRQGDVLIERVNDATLTGTQEPGEAHILAHGEMTGHHHLMHGPRVAYFRDGRGGGIGVVPDTAEVTHQEHGPIALWAGQHKVTRQREYAPGAVRNVED